MIESLLSLAAPKLLGGLVLPFGAVIGSFFTKNRLTIYFALAGLLCGGAGGVYVTRQFWLASQAAEVNAAMAQKDLRFKVVIKTETVVSDHLQVIHEKGEEIIHEIPVYITSKAEKACPAGLPDGFVRLHDAAAANRTPGRTTVPYESPTGIALADAAEVVADNYTQYAACREQVLGWISFYSCLRSAKNDSDLKRCFPGH